MSSHLYKRKTHSLRASRHVTHRLAQPLGGGGRVCSPHLAELVLVADEEHGRVRRGRELGVHREHVEEVLQ